MSSSEHIFKIPKIPPLKPLKKRSYSEGNLLIFNDRSKSNTYVKGLTDEYATIKAVTEPTDTTLTFEDRAFVNVSNIKRNVQNFESRDEYDRRVCKIARTVEDSRHRSSIKRSKSETNVQYLGDKNAGISQEESSVCNFKEKEPTMRFSMTKKDLDFQKRGLWNKKRTNERIFEFGNSSKRFTTERSIPGCKNIAAAGNKHKFEPTLINPESRDPRIRAGMKKLDFEYANQRTRAIMEKLKPKLDHVDSRIITPTIKTKQPFKFEHVTPGMRIHVEKPKPDFQDRDPRIRRMKEKAKFDFEYTNQRTRAIMEKLKRKSDHVDSRIIVPMKKTKLEFEHVTPGISVRFEETKPDFQDRDPRIRRMNEKTKLDFEYTNQRTRAIMEKLKSKCGHVDSRIISPLNKTKQLEFKHVTPGINVRFEESNPNFQNRDPRIRRMIENAKMQKTASVFKIGGSTEISTTETTNLSSKDALKRRYNEKGLPLISKDDIPWKRPKSDKAMLNSEKIEQKNKAIAETKALDTSDTEECPCSKFFCNFTPFTSFWRRWLARIKYDREYSSDFKKIPFQHDCEAKPK